MPSNPVILIPARMGASRFPDKVMAEISGAPMIVQVWRRAQAAAVGRVVVAAAEQVIADAIAAEGGEAVLTDPDHPSGSDRIYEALCRIDPGGAHDAVLNVQGDLPTIEPEARTAPSRCCTMSCAGRQVAMPQQLLPKGLFAATAERQSRRRSQPEPTAAALTARRGRRTRRSRSARW